jgi:AAHS family 4-hydroxybenzoate transporter-like MFS transporter
MLVGSLALSVLADRIGRRPVLIGASLFFAIIMLATAHVADIDLMRFIAGLAARWRRYSLMVAFICRLS